MRPTLFARPLLPLLPFLLLGEPGRANPPKFEAQVIDAEIEIGYAVEIGDVDGDGLADILLVDKREISWFRNPTWEKTVIARNLTLRDHVCIAAADIDGDGKVEVVVGAQWNPGETTDTGQSGAVFYLDRKSADAEGTWKPVPLYHDPTTHRMRWIANSGGDHVLVVLPLHGIGNVQGAGENHVQVTSYRVDPAKAHDSTAWETSVFGAKLHVTHNFDHRDGHFYIGGAQGIVREAEDGSESTVLVTAENSSPPTRGVGEIGKGSDFIAAIEPFHGNDLVVYRESGGTWERTLLTDSLHQGHALGVGDIDGDGLEDIVAGWRNPDAEGHVGIRLFLQRANGTWEDSWVTKDLVATEDLKLVDLDKDGRLDIVASGRSTNNLVIFWNRE